MSGPRPDVKLSTGPVRFGRCELRLDTRELLVAGRPEPVRRLVFDLIAFLVAQRHRVVTHKELLREVWGNTEVSSKMLARSVMEARRACGDPADDPKIFISVRGVGYRFVGTLADEPALQPGADGPGPGPDPGAAGSTRALLRQARLALAAGQLDDAQASATQALAEADQNQSNTDRVLALALCSALAMRRDTAVAAARLAAQALQLARAEGQPQLVAQARLAVGYVHLVAGDRALALRHFEESREALSVPGYEHELQTCLNRLALALREAGKPEVGLQINRRALAVARQLGEPFPIFTERNNEVMFLLYIGDRQSAEGDAEAARNTYEEALALADALLQDQPAGSGMPQRQSALGNRAFALQRLGRVDAAWQALEEFEAGLDPSRRAGSPVFAERQQVTQELRASLLADRGRHDEALQLLSQSVAVAQRLERRGALSRLYGLASDIAERSGQLAQALRWARLQSDAQTAGHSSDATALALILEAEMNAEDLQAELQRARLQIAALLQDNAELRQRAELMRGAVPVAADTGLAPVDQLGAMLSARHRHARAKGLPMCVGLLDLTGPPGSGSGRAAHPPTLLKRIAEFLAEQVDVAYPAVDVGAGRVAFRIRDAGPSRAAEVCRNMLEELQRQNWMYVGREVALSWRCHSADAALFESLEACVHSLAHRAPEAGRLIAAE